MHLVFILVCWSTAVDTFFRSYKSAPIQIEWFASPFHGIWKYPVQWQVCVIMIECMNGSNGLTCEFPGWWFFKFSLLVFSPLPLQPPMPTFQSKPYRQSQALNPLVTKVKKHPFLFFGLPFIGIIVGGSFALSQITQTRFDHRDMRHSKVCYIVTCFCMMFIPFILSGCERRSIGNGQE